MALLTLGDERPTMVRIDLALLVEDDGIDAVSGVPAGAHWLAVQHDDGGWSASWVHVDDGADGSGVPYPMADHDEWAALTSHVRAEPVTPALDGVGGTRFERLVTAFGGPAGVLDELQRSFVEWVLPADGGAYDAAAGERWRRVVVALTAAGDPGVAAEPDLLDAAARTLSLQLPQVATGVVEDSLLEALDDLAADLADGGLSEAAAALRSAL